MRNLLFFSFFSLIMLLGLPASDAANIPFEEGEKFIYTIKKFGLKAGKATLEFKGDEVLDGRKVHLVVFTAKALNFFDEEKIYVDPDSFYPLRVERDLDIWGSKEKITEEYLVEKGIVRITKEVEGKPSSEQVIEKEGIIDNLYCFIYRFRMGPEPQVSEGESFMMNLPTKDVKIKVVKETEIKAAGEKYSSYYLESEPKQYKVWFGTSAKRVPLRIDGAAGMISSSLVLSEIEK